ncbi:synaptic vesicle glycoprotein 2A-like isoform X4 [Plodia interpunctella]|nr:synaptic vesicle glycoprotein 2A-like isoform X4 [Plodia interpunctella]
MMESLAIGYVMTVAECDLSLTVIEKGLINSAAFIGILSTGIFWGYLSDNYGRRKVMLPALFCSTTCSLCSATFSYNFASMFTLRFITGCLVSASSATVFAFIGEMHNNAKRATAIMFASTAIGITFIVEPILGWVILSGTWSFQLFGLTISPWRVFMWTWSVPGLSAAIILLFLPESPRYLLANIGPEPALAVLSQMFAINMRKKRDEFPVSQITDASKVAARHGFKVAFLNLIHLGQPPLRRCVIISHICMFTVFMMNSALYTWLPDIFHVLYTNFQDPVSICEIMVDYYTNLNPNIERLMLTVTKECDEKIVHYMVYPTCMIMGILCSATYVTIGYVVKKWSKIKFYCWVLGVCSIMLTVSALIKMPPVAVVLYVIGVCSGATASLLSAITVEVFPTSVRALALCTLYMCGRLGAAVGSNLVGFAFHDNCEVLFMIMCLGTAASVLLLILWPDPKAVRANMESHGFVY